MLLYGLFMNENYSRCYFEGRVAQVNYFYSIGLYIRPIVTDNDGALFSFIYKLPSYPNQ